MNNDQLTKGNEISKKISDLTNHLKTVRSEASPMSEEEANGGHRISKDRPLAIRTYYRGDYSYTQLHGELINADEFIAIYVMRIENKIAELQKEFDSL